MNHNAFRSEPAPYAVSSNERFGQNERLAHALPSASSPFMAIKLFLGRLFFQPDPTAQRPIGMTQLTQRRVSNEPPKPVQQNQFLSHQPLSATTSEITSEMIPAQKTPLAPARLPNPQPFGAQFQSILSQNQAQIPSPAKNTPVAPAAQRPAFPPISMQSRTQGTGLFPNPNAWQRNRPNLNSQQLFGNF